MKHALITALLLAPLVPQALQAAAPPSPQRNVVFLLADDLQADCLGMLGHPVVKTPNLDKLLENGFAFRNAYTLGSNQPAVCLPSRTMILTGESYLRKNPTATPTLAQTIKAAGYASIRSGKFHANPNDLDKDFDQHVDGGEDAASNADNIIAFIKEHAGQKPLFLYFAPNEPHIPHHATDEFYQMYKPSDIPLPVNFLPLHPFNNGYVTGEGERQLPWPRTRENVTEKLARYYASVSYFDQQAGRIIEALKQAGQFENTIFIMAGDNGMSLGEHGLVAKQNVYEFGGMHVPLIFAGPGIAKGDSKALAYLFDVYPTLYELAGIPVPAELDAKSLAPVIKGAQPRVRDCLFTAYGVSQRSIRDDRWKLIRYPRIDKTQLFDLQADPHEMDDLAGKPESEGKIKELTALLEKTRREYGDTVPLQVRHPEPAAWTPPAPGSEPTKKEKRNKKP
uniref:sulfatase-like hydrolase/transferase n=1 Tax=Prosthecobacter sp. TaxID=1965333 RepID=UPI003783D925